MIGEERGDGTKEATAGVEGAGMEAAEGSVVRRFCTKVAS
jgi:hypothetical protein